jgi:hypothetical protein
LEVSHTIFLWNSTRESEFHIQFIEHGCGWSESSTATLMMRISGVLASLGGSSILWAVAWSRGFRRSPAASAQQPEAHQRGFSHPLSVVLSLIGVGCGGSYNLQTVATAGSSTTLGASSSTVGSETAALVVNIAK